MTKKTFEIKIENELLPGENRYNALHIEGESGRVYVYSHFGNGISGDVYSNQTIEFKLPDCCEPAKVSEFIDANSDTIETILKGYSSKHNGQNWKGYWSEDAAEARDNFEIEIRGTGRLGPEYYYHDADDFVNEAWGDDFLDEYPDKPETPGEAYLVAKKIMTYVNPDTMLRFDENDLAEYLWKEKENIWEDKSDSE